MVKYTRVLEPVRNKPQNAQIRQICVDEDNINAIRKGDSDSGNAVDFRYEAMSHSTIPTTGGCRDELSTDERPVRGQGLNPHGVPFDACNT